MDFLNNLQKLTLSDDKTSKSDNHTPPLVPAPKHDTVLDKLSDALGGSHATPPPPSVAVPAPAPKHDNVFNKIGDALTGSHSTPAPVSVATPTSALSAHESVLDKLGNALGGLQHHATSTQNPAPAPATVPAKHESVLDKIGGVLNADSHKTTPAPAPAPKKDEGLLGKIGDAISGRKTPPPPPKEQNLFDKISHVVSGKEEPPARPQGLADKINDALGGGAKGEAEEDKLDKAIDLFQEHVLKEGPQNNESALEQAKDKQIADTIRHALGREKK